MTIKKAGAFSIIITMVLVPLCAWALNTSHTNSVDIASLKTNVSLRGSQLDRMESKIDKLLEE